MNTAIAKYTQGKMKHELQAGAHQIISDVSVEEGGENLGPSPHDLLAMALASCTSITLRMYATRKGWPLVSADTTVTLDQHRSNVKFNRQIHLVGDLNDEQKSRLLDISNRCPIHQALKGQIEILSSLV